MKSKDRSHRWEIKEFPCLNSYPEFRPRGFLPYYLLTYHTTDTQPLLGRNNLISPNIPIHHCSSGPSLISLIPKQTLRHPTNATRVVELLPDHTLLVKRTSNAVRHAADSALGGELFPDATGRIEY